MVWSTFFNTDFTWKKIYSKAKLFREKYASTLNKYNVNLKSFRM